MASEHEFTLEFVHFDS